MTLLLAGLMGLALLLRQTLGQGTLEQVIFQADTHRGTRL